MKYCTLEELHNCDSVHDAINFALGFVGKYPVKPKKPNFPHEGNSDDIIEYGYAMREYDAAMIAYAEAQLEYDKTHIANTNVLEEYIKQVAMIDKVPEQYQDKVWQHAYETGHSGGYYQVYLNLCNLINIFL